MKVTNYRDARSRVGFADGPRINRHRRDSGSIALEFAILLPFLIMILIGVVDLDLILYDKAAMINSAREGARAGTVVRAVPLTTAQIAALVTTDVQAALVTGGTASVPQVTVTQPDGTISGDPLYVTISYTYNGLILGSVLSTLTGPIVLNETVAMNYE
jgi:Flp pilus assembly protein TadG